jgi:hypothetical protein
VPGRCSRFAAAIACKNGALFSKKGAVSYSSLPDLTGVASARSARNQRESR